MPIYEFKCDQCGREFEELVMNSREKVRCPDCGKTRVKKLISRTGSLCTDKSGGACAAGPSTGFS